MYEQLLLASGATQRAPIRGSRVLYPTPSAPRASRATGPDLGGDAQAIAQVVGTSQALRLIGQLPRCLSGSAGRQSMQPMLYVPKQLAPDHLLVRLLGMADAQALVDAFGGECLKPSGCTEVYRRFRDREIRAMRQDGWSVRLVAEVFGVTERIVSRVTGRELSGA